MHLLTTIKESYFDAATEYDLAAAKPVIRRESQKLSLLDSRLEIYATVLQQVAQVAFNEIRLATDHTSNNDAKVKRAIVTFKQAGMLVDAVSLTEVAKHNKLIVDISNISPMELLTPMLPNVGCLSQWHDAGREETVLHAVRADQIFRSQLARSSCGTPYSALARIYARTYEKKASR